MSKNKEGKFCDEGIRPNEILFPSPLHVSCWLSADHFLVGGGGGLSKFGMSNSLVLLKSVSKKGSRPWEPVQALNMGEGVVWCLSPTIPHPTESGALIFLTSSVKAFSIVKYSKEELSMVKELPLEADELNPDKKPVALTSSGYGFVAQDDLTVLAFTIEDMMGKGKTKANATLSVWSGRIRSLDAREVGDSIFLASASEDKVIRLLALSNKNLEVTKKFELNEKALGLPFGLLKSSLRSAKFLSNTELLLNTFDAHSGHTTLLKSEVAKDGKMTLESVHTSVKGEGITCLTPFDSESKDYLMSTVDGNFFKLHTKGSPFTITKIHKGVHSEPVSSVAISSSGVVVSTDIGQKALMNRVTMKKQQKQVPVNPKLPLVLQSTSHIVRLFFIILGMLSLLVAVLLARP